MNDTEEVLGKLSRLRQLGVKIAMMKISARH